MGSQLQFTLGLATVLAATAHADGIPEPGIIYYGAITNTANASLGVSYVPPLNITAAPATSNVTNVGAKLAQSVNAADYSSLIASGVTSASLTDFQHIPVCSAGGSYSLSVGHSGDSSTFKVTCGFGDHGTFEPGEDAR